MLKNLRRDIGNIWRIRRWRSKGAGIGRNCLLGKSIDLEVGTGRVELDSHVRISTGCVLHTYGGQILIGDHTFLGPYCILYGHGGIEIGRDCLIAGHTCIASANHEIPPQGTPIRTRPNELLPVKIGNDVWIGFSCTILGGVTIGDGAVVGAGSVVTRDVGPGTIVTGNPARILRERTSGSFPQ